MTDILRFESRPFKSIDAMNAAIKRSCEQRAKAGDTIIHVGDLYSFGSDRGNSGMKMKPADFLSGIHATFVNLRGNHDLTNRVKSLGDSMRISLGRRYPTVSVCHYPSYDPRCKGHFLDGDIHICGHVHRKWRHCLDLTHKVLNVNVGLDVSGFKILSEDEVIQYIDSLLRRKPDDLYRCKVSASGRVEFFGEPSF